MFVLLCGYPPFFGDTDSEVLAKVHVDSFKSLFHGQVKTGSYNFNPSDWKNVSEELFLYLRG